MTLGIVVVGAGGFGRETLDVIEALSLASDNDERRVIGVVDDDPSPIALERLGARSVPWLGTLRQWLESGRGDQYVVAIGSPTIRARIDANIITAGGVASPALIHPAAHIGTLTRLGCGSVVCAGAQISTNVSLGRNTHVNPNVTIGHDVVARDHVSINPGAIISGEVQIGHEVLVGAGAVVLQGLEIGRRVTVGAAACVTRSVFDGRTVKGVPAR